MIRKESCVRRNNVWRKSGSQEKEGEQKRVVPLIKPTQKRSKCLGFYNLGFLEECFGFGAERERERERDLLFFLLSVPHPHIAHHHHQRRRLLGCLSIFARRTHDALFFARYSRFSSLSSSSSSSLAFLGATTTPTKGAILRLFLCCVIVCGVENSKRERERETYRKERHTHA